MASYVGYTGTLHGYEGAGISDKVFLNTNHSTINYNIVYSEVSFPLLCHVCSFGGGEGSESQNHSRLGYRRLVLAKDLADLIWYKPQLAISRSYQPLAQHTNGHQFVLYSCYAFLAFPKHAAMCLFDAGVDLNKFCLHGIILAMYQAISDTVVHRRYHAGTIADMLRGYNDNTLSWL